MMNIKGVILLFIFIFSMSNTWAQVDYSKKSTGKVKKRPELLPENDNETKRLLSIYTKDTKKILYGNPCMDAVTQRFGFEYVVMPKNAPGFSSGFQKFFHNLGVKTVLFFRNPLWGIIAKKESKECRQKTGDYAG
ncbi:hypothetical protein JKA74_13440 [Marivirga sp. S37H4]|uniref:DUF1343 domain-containing protein n=1 Tax=Marivirga aurantiaca TaxID=2802615 RepID=A0A934X0C0_9BACT|nr:hypothetical protein [Marivirga aurantiaca]MBK6266041.1 hypothetical protein [Marivirga aurantiaca]